jgi:hypothetical protein
VRFKFIQIATFQDKAFATKWHKMGNIWLTSKAKLKGGQIQERAQENLI